MTGGLIQLVAYGEQDIFLTTDPQITFFKVIYRRHTNFSTEQIPQKFIHTPNFGKKVSCTLFKNGDLVNNIIVAIQLPSIPQLYNTDGSVDELTKFAWIRKIGYGILKEIEIEIGGQIIDKHYGEWLNIWADLVGMKDRDINNAIGNIPKLYEYSSTKDSYMLYIPLQFWFCRTASMSLPLMCLQYSDVKINIEFADATNCYTTTPTHYIVMDNDVVNFKQYEYISQYTSSGTAYGMFLNFDSLTKKLYYNRIGSQSLVAINDTSYSSYTQSQKQTIKDTYAIIGSTSNYSACPQINTSDTSVFSVAYTANTYKNIRILDCFLLIDYIFLDDEERHKFYNSEHEYLIDQLIYTGSSVLDGVNRAVKIGLINPCKLMVWTAQLNYLLDKRINDTFNYTDSFMYDSSGHQTGNGIILQSTIQLNGRDRMQMQDNIYYNYVQPMQYFKYAPSNGINIYSFSLNPDNPQPSGSCNMSTIDNISISMKLGSYVSIANPVTFKCYGLTTNLFRIVSGLGGTVFNSQN